MSCTIVIPIYTTKLTSSEQRAILQCRTVLSRHRIVFVTPVGLDISALGTGLEQKTFNASYFESVYSYNFLMLSREFYATFADSDYILIYQTDAWVFADHLDEWCAKGYDYIGAPWLGKSWQLSVFYRPILSLKSIYARITKHGRSALRKWNVGNGGLSLRNPNRFIEVLDILNYNPTTLLRQNNFEYNEDVIWSIILKDYLRIPNWEEAIHFAIESKPAWAMKWLKGQMPFGCHGWNKAPYDEFWQKQYIKI